MVEFGDTHVVLMWRLQAMSLGQTSGTPYFPFQLGIDDLRISAP